MNKKTFDEFRARIYEHSGISLGEAKMALVSSRMSKRIRTLGLADYEAYLDYLDRDGSGNELVQMLDAISTNVTNFFREPQHFEFLREIVEGWVRQGQRRLRVWSAASSTGEEPYTIAMTLCEAVGDANVDMKILATDISTRVLEKARLGVYEQSKLGPISAPMRDRFFIRNRAEDTWQVKPQLQKMVTYKRLNLSQTPFPMQGPLDVVFCRNVMIYFDNTIRKRLLDEIYRLLKPGGYLMVGHAESLTSMITDFKTVKPAIYIKE